MHAIISTAIFPGRKEDGGPVSRHTMKTKERTKGYRFRKADDPQDLKGEFP